MTQTLYAQFEPAYLCAYSLIPRLLWRGGVQQDAHLSNLLLVLMSPNNSFLRMYAEGV